MMNCKTKGEDKNEFIVILNEAERLWFKRGMPPNVEVIKVHQVA